MEKRPTAATGAANFLDRDRISGNQYELVSRDDGKRLSEKCPEMGAMQGGFSSGGQGCC